MTDKNEQAVREALARARATPADGKARERAVAAALEAFDQVGAEGQHTADKKNADDGQASGTSVRPMGTANEKGRTTMQQKLIKWGSSSVIAASVLVAVTVVWYQQDGLDSVVVDDRVAQSPQTSVDSVSAPAPAKAKQAELADRASSQAPSQAPVLAEELRKESRQEADSVAGIRGLAAEQTPGRLKPSAPLAREPVPAPGYQDQGRDDFTHYQDNPVHRVVDTAVSTFAVDVDTASYSFVRRQLNQGVLPQQDAVRVEEMINYFDYAYPLPQDRSTPFATHVQVMQSPWKPANKLLHIGLQGYDVARQARPRTNLVFLLDVSGSMNSPDKLPLVKQSLELLLSQLGDQDRVAIAVYAGAAGTVLPPTPASDRQAIRAALDGLQAGGSTAGGEGIQLAYQLARDSFDDEAVNRVILATDGDFNVGITDTEELKGFVTRQREKGIYLSVLGFGQGNYHDSLMQALAQNGNGIAAYIDTLGEAQKVLVEEATSALFPIANDVKVQVHFNPATVAEYRLIGYETRALQREDFNNDKVDAGDIGAGHSVTAIYEFTPVSSEPLIDAGRYESSADKPVHGDEYAFVRLRYKLPGETTSRLIEQPVRVSAGVGPAPLDREARFATAVAGFGQLLRGGRYTGDWDYAQALSLAQANKGDDPYGYRTEFVQLIRKAKMAADL